MVRKEIPEKWSPFDNDLKKSEIHPTRPPLASGTFGDPVQPPLNNRSPSFGTPGVQQKSKTRGAEPALTYDTVGSPIPPASRQYDSLFRLQPS